MSSGGREDSGEKSHEPTPKRLEDARRRGDIAKSDEVTAAAVYLGLLLAVAAGGAVALQSGAGALAAFLGNADQLTGVILGPGGRGVAALMLGDVLRAVGLILLLPAIGAMASLLAQQALTFSGDKIVPKLQRLSPLAALKNKFGPTGLMEFAKRLAKMTAVSLAAAAILIHDRDLLIGALHGAPGPVSALMLVLVRDLLIWVTVTAVAIAVLDLAWVRFDHRRKLRMTLQELRDETKEAEGDPMLKAKRRRRATEIASNRMLTDVPTADVVIVNPTHVAVALKWSRQPGAAPVCVAKGTDEMAATIRELAEGAGVPIHRDPPTARLLHQIVEIGQEIPPEQYRAVAAAIRFAEEMRRRARERNGPPA